MSDRRPTYAHKTALIIYDGLKGFFDGGASCGRRPDGDTDSTYRFLITHSVYADTWSVDLDIPDVAPGELLTFDELIIERRERGHLLLKVDGVSMPFRTALVLCAIRLKAAEWWK